MEVIRDYLSSDHRCRPKGNYKKTSITIHSTANANSTAKNERAWLDNASNNRSASWHYCIDENTIIQAIPDKEVAWHCSTSEGNKYSLSIEICESGDRERTLLKAIEFTAYKLKELGLTTANLKRHYDWTGKNCPRILIDKAYIKNDLDWDWFVKKVGELMTEKRYNTIEELPSWGKSVIKELVDKGAIADGNNLNLSEDMLRVIVILKR